MGIMKNERKLQVIILKMHSFCLFLTLNLSHEIVLMFSKGHENWQILDKTALYTDYGNVYIRLLRELTDCVSLSKKCSAKLG